MYTITTNEKGSRSIEISDEHLETLNRYDPRELKKRLTVYERCDKKIRECL